MCGGTQGAEKERRNVQIAEKIQTLNYKCIDIEDPPKNR